MGLVDSDKRMVIIDASYIMHVMVSSSKSEYEKKFGPMSDGYDVGTDDDFLSMVQTRITRFISNTKKNNMGAMAVFAWDDSKKNLWRHALDAEYKMHRIIADSTKEGPNMYGAWKWYKEHCNGRTDIINVFVPRCEGDDVIARLVERYHSDYEIRVITSDSDMAQLSGKAEVFDMFGKNVIESTFEKFKVDNANDYILVKAITGDKADNIPQVFPRVGPATAAKAIKDKEYFRKKLLPLNPNWSEMLKSNKSLIDMMLIPDEIKAEIDVACDNAMNSDIMFM